MTDLSRVVLVTPHRTLEMALPSLVPLADLMPVLVQRATMPATPDRAGRSQQPDHDWVLQRLGGMPLDEDLTPASLQIRDGETLYLRPRDSQLPPVHFDDLVDGLATGVRHLPDRWRDSLTRALFLVLGAAGLATAFLVLAHFGESIRGGLAAGVAVLASLGAMMVSRALGDSWATVTLGLSALPFAWLAGYTVPPLAADGSAQPRLVCAAAAASVTALLVTFAAGHFRPMFLAVWLSSAAIAAAAALVMLGLTPAQASAAMVVVALLSSALAPSVAFRLALLRLPQLPTSAADLSEDIEPYPGTKLISGAVVADTYLTWLLAAVGLVCAVGLVLLSRAASGWPETWFVVCVVLVLAFRSRGLSSGWQRAATLTPAVAATVALIVRLAEGGGRFTVAVVVMALVATAVAMVALSRALPGRRLLPYWGRIADITEYLVALAIVLLLLGIFDIYHWARALAG